VRDFGMLFLLMKMLWLRMSSLFYGRIDRDMNAKFWIVLKYCNECNG